MIKKYYKINILFFPLFFSFFCKTSNPYTGKFGWRSIDQRDFTPIEEILSQPKEFYFGRDKLYFGDYETIWWIYQFDQKLFFKPKFIVVLYSEINSPQPVEIDLRVVLPEFQDGFYFIRQYYLPLMPGKYIIKIAEEEKQVPFDSVEFMVLEEKEYKQISGPIQF